MADSAAPSPPTRVSAFQISIPCPWHLVMGEESAVCWQDGPDAEIWFAIGLAEEFPTLEAGRQALAGVPALPEAAPRCFATVAFDPFRPVSPPWQAYPARRIILPRLLVHWRQNEATCLSFGAAPHADPRALLSSAGSSSFKSQDSTFSERTLFERDQWRVAVGAIQQEIANSALRKVVLSRQLILTTDGPIDAAAVLAKLSAHSQDSILFATHQPGEGVFLGLTPERLFRQHREHLVVDSLAGTRPRGKTAQEDEQLAQDLIHSSKDRHEQQLVTQHITSSLRPFCGQVHADEAPRVRQLATVQHLYTRVDAELHRQTTLDDLLNTLHPTPATCGLPVARARDLIAQLEPEPRGLYAGVVGWIGVEDVEFAVAIRSGLIHENTARLFAGAGIVERSDADTEFDECSWKMQLLRHAL